jgi:hypothetical protein
VSTFSHPILRRRAIGAFGLAHDHEGDAMSEHHPYYSADRQFHPLRALTVIAAGLLAVALLFVWSAGEVVGGLWHGSWPAVSFADSAAELLQLCQHPGEPVAPGIPGGPAYLAVLSLLVLAAGAVALWLLRLMWRPRVYWAPPRTMSRSSYQPFLTVYRRGPVRRWR